MKNNDNIPSEIPVQETIGKSLLGLMCPQLLYAVHHDTIPLLQGYAQDKCPVDCGKDWSREHIDLMPERGPHRSANGKRAVCQLRQETEDKVKHKYAIILKWCDIKNYIPNKIQISPVAMIPQKSKPFRCIMDILFTMFHKGVKISCVNKKTHKMAFPEAMAQLGQVVKIIIYLMELHRHHACPLNSPN